MGSWAVGSLTPREGSAGSRLSDPHVQQPGTTTTGATNDRTFNPPLVRREENLTPDQKTRAAALLVAQQARPMGTADEHLRARRLRRPRGALCCPSEEQRRSPLRLFGHRQMDLDPVRPVNRVPNWADLDP